MFRILRIWSAIAICCLAGGAFAQNLLPTYISTAPFYFNAQPMMYPSVYQPYQLPNYWQQQPNFLMSALPQITNMFTGMLESDFGGSGGSSSGRYYDYERDDLGYITDKDFLYSPRESRRSSYRSSSRSSSSTRTETTATPTPTPAPVATATTASIVAPTPVATATVVPVIATNPEEVERIYEGIEENEEEVLTFNIDDKNEDIDIELDATLHNVVAILGDPDQMGRGVALICMEQNDKQVMATSASLGGRRVLATMYQTCKALDPVIDGTFAINNNVSRDSRRKRSLSNSTIPTYLNMNPFSRERETPPGPGCFNIADKPPVYGYGAKPTSDSNSVNVTMNQAVSGRCGPNGISCGSHAIQSIDCSGFIAAALATQGLRLKSGQDFNPAWFSTTYFASAARERNSCFADVPISTGVSIMPGDIISYANNHVIMIDEVGDDPLGIKKYSQAGRNCNDIHYRDFDFTYMHSGSIGNYGPARVSSKYHQRVPGTIFKTLRVKAIEACRAIKSGATAAKISQGNFGVIRHRGNAVDGCVGEAKPLDGEQCVAGCFPARSK